LHGSNTTPIDPGCQGFFYEFPYFVIEGNDILWQLIAPKEGDVGPNSLLNSQGSFPGRWACTVSHTSISISMSSMSTKSEKTGLKVP